MRTLLIACLLMVAPTASGAALFFDEGPTPGLPGFKTYTILI